MKIAHTFNIEEGEQLYYDFMQRHPDISLIAPKSSSMIRSVGIKKLQVDIFYNNLEKLITRISTFQYLQMQ